MKKIRETLKNQLPYTLKETNLGILGDLTRGKVRDVYTKGDELFIVTTDRISAFDHILGTIPFKGQLLNQITLYAFSETANAAPNHILGSPDPNVLHVQKTTPFPVEFVMRGYLTGSLYRDYEKGNRFLYGIQFEEALLKDQAFERPILTPTTKAEIGMHDQATSKEEIIASNKMSERDYVECEELAKRLFETGSKLARKKNLILVDTKYEFGKTSNGKIIVIDEIHTPDSSRYWELEGYEERFKKGEMQRMLDKENLRQWLIQNYNYMGDGPPPLLTDEIRISLAEKYIELAARVTGIEPVLEVTNTTERIQKNLRSKIAL